jgi:hypothetical protein
MNEKQFTPAEIYNKMIAESLGFPEMAAMIDPPTSHQCLRSHIKSYCKESNKPMPSGAKKGRKPAVKTFRIKGKEFTSAEIYEKMIKENLNFVEMAKEIEPKISQQCLRYHIELYCKESNKPMPASAKRGRKPAFKTFKIKE